MKGKHKILQGLVNVVSGAVIVGALLFFVRLFLFISVVVPSNSMEPTIRAGEYIMVNKCVPGIRIFNSDSVQHRMEIKRTVKAGKIRRNDVLVFNFPYHRRNRISFDSPLYYIKRCVAIPGDTFYIENGFYKVENSTSILGVYLNQQHFSHKTCKDYPAEYFTAFPKNSKYYNWTIKDFGKLYVPRKGDILPVDTVNIDLYRNLIEYETGQKITVDMPFVLLNDSVIEFYTFAQNYYFMAGDNVADSQDSRYWGLLPEDHIAGKALFIWKSIEPQTGKMRWERIMNMVK